MATVTGSSGDSSHFNLIKRVDNQFEIPSSRPITETPGVKELKAGKPQSPTIKKEKALTLFSSHPSKTGPRISCHLHELELLWLH